MKALRRVKYSYRTWTGDMHHTCPGSLGCPRTKSSVTTLAQDSIWTNGNLSLWQSLYWHLNNLAGGCCCCIIPGDQKKWASAQKPQSITQQRSKRQHVLQKTRLVRKKNPEKASTSMAWHFICTHPVPSYQLANFSQRISRGENFGREADTVRSPEDTNMKLDLPQFCYLQKLDKVPWQIHHSAHLLPFLVAL